MFWKQNDTVSLLPQEKELQGWTTKSWTLQGNTPRLSHLGDRRGFDWFIARTKQGWTWIGPSSILVPISYLPTYKLAHNLSPTIHIPVLHCQPIPCLWCYLIVTLVMFFHCIVTSRIKDMQCPTTSSMIATTIIKLWQTCDFNIPIWTSGMQPTWIPLQITSSWLCWGLSRSCFSVGWATKD